MFDMADTQITTTTHPTKDDGYSAISLLPASSLWFCVAMCGHVFVWSAFQVFRNSI